MLAVVLAVVGAVTGIWFAYIAAAAALLFAAFVWVRASREINGRGGKRGRIRIMIRMRPYCHRRGR